MSEALPIFAIGSTVVEQESWRGLLWSAVPTRVVSSTEAELITSLPAGTRWIAASNRDLPYAAGMTRSERKLQAMRTCVAQGVEFATPTGDAVRWHRPGRWSRIDRIHDHDTGALGGWYVNFQRPPEPTAAGIATKDLVLDLWVEPDGSWAWKDDEDFDRAIEVGVLDVSLRATFAGETERVLRELHDGSGPFDLDREVEIDHSLPTLPVAFGWHGDAWTLPWSERG